MIPARRRPVRSDGGAAAGLYSIVGLEELLELGARARAAARRASEAPALEGD